MERKNALLSVIIGVLAITVVVIGVMAFTDYENNDEGTPTTTSRTTTPPVTVTVRSFDECVGAGYSVTGNNPRECRTPGGQMFTEEINNGTPAPTSTEDLIRVASPLPGDEVRSPIYVRGEARGNWFFEASAPVEIVDLRGNVITSTFMTAGSDWMTENFVPFRKDIVFSVAATTSAFLVLHNDNPSDLRENDREVRIPLILLPPPIMQRTVKLYFYNESKDRDSTGNVQCTKNGLVAVEKKIPVTLSPIKDTLNLLLATKGTIADRDAGLTTYFPLAGVKVENVVLISGLLTVTFSDPNNKLNGGACRVSIIRAQIEETLKQFPEVKNVKFKPEALFQP